MWVVLLNQSRMRIPYTLIFLGYVLALLLMGLISVTRFFFPF